jgi:hypothetical protein
MSFSPSVFESFNAKNLNAEQVARTFVPSESFAQLSSRRNSIVVGPRGSGKTTLLKMLTPEALGFWKGDQATFYRQSIDFSGVFIPTDRVWKEQIEILSSTGFSEEDRLLIGRALFSSHVLTKLAQTMQYRCAYESEGEFGFRRLSLVRDREAELVRSLSLAWGLKPNIPSFRGLLTALSTRKLDIPKFVSAESRRPAEGRDERIAEQPALHINYLAASAVGIEIFEQHLNTFGEKWALLFDELELAPTYVVQDLVDGLRGGDDRVLFKMSMAPYSPDVHMLRDLMSAMPGNDFDFVVLWYATKADGARDFCRDLFRSMVSERAASGVAPEDVFGYSPGSDFDKLFTLGREKDPSFGYYLREHRIDLPSSIAGEARRAELVRKIAPIVRSRVEYLQTLAPRDKKPPTFRSRKALPSMYGGVDALFDMMEGNPRWFIGVIGPLLQEFFLTGKRVPVSRQLQEVQKATAKFVALLRTIPCPRTTRGNEPAGVDKAIDAIGQYFSSQIHREAFRAEPPGTIIVDLSVSEEFEASLGAALNAGALVYLHGPTSELVLGTLKDRRFRLCFLLAPRYKLPLILMKAVSLKRIFSKSHGDQLALFESNAGE